MILFSFVAISACLFFLFKFFVRKKKPKKKKKSPYLAVVGMACRLPDGTNSCENFHSKLLKGHDFIKQAPSNRWNRHRYVNENNVFGKMVTSFGGYISSLFDFDNRAFSINKTEAMYMDPQQKLLLEVSMEALEDSNVKYLGTNTGVFIGAGSTDHAVLRSIHESYLNDKVPLGTALAILSNRISHKFDLRGPSLTIDTACSSSGVAMYMASQAILNGDCKCALVGGVHLVLHPLSNLGQSRLSVASKSGRCRTFTKDADGYVRAEACGIVIVKKLDDALKDGDKIYCVLKSTKSNQDGSRAPSISMPSSMAQKEVLQSALKDAKVKPRDVFFIEAHGTGTKVGDPIELNGLIKVLCKSKVKSNDDHKRKRKLRIGSVKSNLGHAEFAAYVTSLIKCCLMLDHKMLYPNIHYKPGNLNPKIRLGKMAKIMTKVEKFEKKEENFVICSYGIGGSNVCSILQGYDGMQNEKKDLETKKKLEEIPNVEKLNKPPYVYFFAAQTENSLEKRIEQFKELSKSKKYSQIRLMYTLNTWKLSHYRYKTFALGENLETAKIFPIVRSKDQESPLAFVFSGQGPQHYHMGRSLFHHFKVFRKTVLSCEKFYKRYSGVSLLKMGLFGKEISNPNKQAVYEVQYTLPSLVIFQISLFELLKSLGIVPDVAIGHSLGEISALYACGFFTLEVAMKVVYTRVKLVRRFDNLGRMIAIRCTSEEIDDLLAAYEDKAFIAAYNSPTFFTIGGTHDAIKSIEKECKKRKFFGRVLRITNAYHTPLLSVMKDKAISMFRRCLGKGGLKKVGKTKLISTSTRLFVREEDVNAEYLYSNIINPVYFSHCVERALEHNKNYVFLELACHPVLSSFMKEIKNIGSCLHFVRRPGKKEKFTLEYEKDKFLINIGKFLCEGRFSIAWHNIIHGSQYMKRIPYLPTYPFQRTKDCYEINLFMDNIMFARYHHEKKSLIGEKLISPNLTYRSFVNTKAFPWLEDHKVQNSILFPAAGMIEIFLELAGTSRLKNFEIFKAVHVPKDYSYSVLSVTQKKKGHLDLYHKPDKPLEKWTLVASCEVPLDTIPKEKALPEKSVKKEDITMDFNTIMKRCKREMDKAHFYKRCKMLNLQYKKNFKLIEKVFVGDEECLCVIDASQIKMLNRFYIHPALLDNTIQCILGAVDTLTYTYIPTGVRECNLYVEEIPQKIAAYAYISDTKGESPKGSVVAFDIESGKIFFELKDLSTTKLKGQHEDSNLTFHELRWQLQNVPPVKIGSRFNDFDCEDDNWKEVYNNIHILHKYILQNIQNDIASIERKALQKYQKRYLQWADDKLAQYKDDLRTPNETVKESDLDKIPHFDMEVELVKRVCRRWKESFLNKNNELAEVFFSDDFLERSYLEAITNRPFLKCFSAIFQNVLSQFPNDRIIRILESGAGTGALSSCVLKVIKKMNKGSRVEYFFTDVSNMFLQTAKKKFQEQYPFVKYAIFNLDSNAIDNHDIFTPNYFDIVIGFNGVHPCSKIDFSLAQLNSILAPNGNLLILELTRPPIYLDFMFGLFKEWFGYDDDREHVIMSKKEWEKRLIHANFSGPQFYIKDFHMFSIIHACKKSLHLGNGIAKVGPKKNHEKKKGMEMVVQTDETNEFPEIIEGKGGWEMLQLFQKRIEKKDQKALAVVTRNGTFGRKKSEKNHEEMSDTIVCPQSAEISGLIRTLLIEHPNWNVKLFDFPSDATNEIVRSVVNEVMVKQSRQKEFEFRFRNGELLVPKMVEALDVRTGQIFQDEKETNGDKKNQEQLYDENVSVVISGGLGSVGFNVAEWLCKHEGVKYICLLSRSCKLKKVHKRVIKELHENFGVNVFISKTDITKREEVLSLWANMKEKKFPMKISLYHLAMVLDDVSISTMSKQSYYKCYDPKVKGIMNLFETFKDPKETFHSILFFSSISGAVGNRNQANYAISNAYLDAFGFLLNQKFGIKARVLALPMIDDAGGVSNDAVLREIIQSNGWMNKVVNCSHVCKWIKIVLSSDEHVRIVPTDSFRVPRAYNQKSNVWERFSHVTSLFESDDDNVVSEKLTKESLFALLKNILDLEEDIVEDEKLVVYGVDSLMAVQLSMELKKRGIALTQMEILSGITTRDILEKMNNNKGKEE